MWRCSFISKSDLIASSPLSSRCFISFGECLWDTMDMKRGLLGVCEVGGLGSALSDRSVGVVEVGGRSICWTGSGDGSTSWACSERSPCSVFASSGWLVSLVSACASTVVCCSSCEDEFSSSFSFCSSHSFASFSCDPSLTFSFCAVAAPSLDKITLFFSLTGPVSLIFLRRMMVRLSFIRMCLVSSSLLSFRESAFFSSSRVDSCLIMLRSSFCLAFFFPRSVCSSFAIGRLSTATLDGYSMPVCPIPNWLDVRSVWRACRARRPLLMRCVLCLTGRGGGEGMVCVLGDEDLSDDTEPRLE
ncbi:hypothetical protein BLNAU_7975 [Blattamonas nauphoetae]|uniref:Uncharacterized protein n=1 Tax=Blattamonas nauphoetae TaxID=2049346 RepID=A0ABQ9Y099_9EUKA|nr:hypothetical protein BLNAU_7975 [Blattamonas nauphoetae]